MSNYFSSEVVLLDNNGQHLGKFSAGKAKFLAKEQGLDLVEIGKQDGLSLCKIMDEGRFLYEQKKKKHGVHQHKSKEIKFGIRIALHDFNIKIDHIKRLLSKGHDIHVIVELHGREKSHPENAQHKIEQIISSVGSLARCDAVKRNSSNYTVVMHPVKTEKHKIA